MRLLILIFLFSFYYTVFSQTGQNNYPAKVCGDLKKRKLLFNCTEPYHPKLFLGILDAIRNEKIKSTYDFCLKTDKQRRHLMKGIFGSLIAGGACFVAGAITFLAALGDSNLADPAIYIFRGGYICLGGSLTCAIGNRQEYQKEKDPVPVNAGRI